MFIPFGTDRPQRRFPWANIALIAANVIVYLFSHNFAPQGPHAPADASAVAHNWIRFMLNPGPQFGGLHVYQFITYQFLHEGFSHIGFNMLFLYVFGNNLNEKLGHLGYLLFYLAGGVLAGCGQVLAAPGAPTLGASGAISAVTGLYLVLLPRTHIKLFIWFFFADVWEIPSLYFILFKVGQDIFEQFTGSAGVAYMAHISGAGAGVIVGLILLFSRLVQRDHYDLLAMLNRYRRRQEYQSIVARGYDPFAPRPLQPARPPRAGLLGQPGDPPASAVDPRIESLRAEIARLLRIHDVADATQRYLDLRQIDATQVLPPQEQVDIASQLMSAGQYAAAAAAYEDYLRVYPTGGAGQQTQITLILGLIYARYFPNPARARQLFQQVLPSLHNPQERALAESELQALGGPLPSAPPPNP